MKISRDNLIAIADQTWATECAEIKQLINYINQDSFIRCVKVLDDCSGKIITTGAGTSAAAAKKISHSLCCVGVPSFYLVPSDAVHGGLGAVCKNDVVIAISKGGNTHEIISMLPAIKSKDAFLIGVTENEQSVLASSSDLFIKIKIQKEPDPFGMLATASTIAVIAFFDAVCIALMKIRKFTKQEFALIHPGGAVGEKLRESLKQKSK